MPKKLIDPRSSITEETSRRIANALEYIAIADAKDIDITDYQQIANIVKAGRAKDFFKIGDQIHTTWTSDSGTEYDMPWDVVDFRPATGPDGVVHENAMWLESHYGIVNVIFDSAEAFYVPNDDMPAGTYHISFAEFMGSKCPAGTFVMFTVNETIPAKSRLIFGTSTLNNPTIFEKDISEWKIRIYKKDNCTLTPDSMLDVEYGSDGTDLGILTSNTQSSVESGPNNHFRLLGYNRWSQSGVRQWLNSVKPAGEWWKPQNPFDGVSTQLGQNGFCYGLEAAFYKIAMPVQITTKLNKMSDTGIGNFEQTCDKFFLSSLSEEFEGQYAYNMLINDSEGKQFSYWKNKYNGIIDQNDLLELRIKYSVTNNNNTSNMWHRTCVETYSNIVFDVRKNGEIRNSSAYNARMVCPCCVIY